MISCKIMDILGAMQTIFVISGRLSDSNYIILLLHVDDMLVVSVNLDEINKLKKQLSNEFEVKDFAIK